MLSNTEITCYKIPLGLLPEIHISTTKPPDYFKQIVLYFEFKIWHTF